MKKHNLSTQPQKKGSFFKWVIITCFIALFTFSQCVLLLPSAGGGQGNHSHSQGNHGNNGHHNH